MWSLGKEKKDRFYFTKEKSNSRLGLSFLIKDLLTHPVRIMRKLRVTLKTAVYPDEGRPKVE